METLNVDDIIRALRSQKPPFECFVCGKVYGSFSGIAYHIRKGLHEPVGVGENGPNQSSFALFSPLTGSDSKDPKLNRLSQTGVESPLARSFVRRQPLTYAEAQKMVEFDVNGDMVRTLMAEPIGIEMESDQQKEEKEITTVNSSPVRIKPLSTPRSKSKLKFTMKKKSYSERRNTAKFNNSENKKANLPMPVVRETDDYSEDEVATREAYFRYIEKSVEELDEETEYDMDEEDYVWLEMVNEERKNEGLAPVSQEVLEMLMDRLEKESHFETQTVNGDPYNYIDEDAVCCICNDGECSNSNVILFCDMCNLAVHQECYGVPYIPEGQWLCRRCLQSPSKPVDCVLCPNKNGAFKQTDCNRWAHVICALWIPEVCFANTVFLEPIDSIANIPPARWKLMCYICRQREGACIQCFKTNCYTAFHVTCAIQAGLHLKMESARNESGQPSVRKSAFCDQHSPKNADNSALSDAESEASVDSKASVSKRGKRDPPVLLKEVHKKVMDEKQHSKRVPLVHIPFIPPHRLSKIVSKVAIAKKANFIQKLQSYWTLKRQSRNGVPLLRRLQANTNGMTNRSQAVEIEISDQAKALKEQLKYWQQLRHDLERARLLVELIRKREKLKREHCKMKQHIVNLQLQPLNILLKRTLDQLQSKDTSEIFSEPVSLEEVPDYLEYIDKPMDFSTMRQNLQDYKYSSLDEFEADFFLMIDNCMTYNAEDTVFYRAAVRLKQLGRPVLRNAKKKIQIAGIDPETGMHFERPPSVSEGAFSEEAEHSENFVRPVKPVIKETSRKKKADGVAFEEMTLEEKLKDLQEKLDIASTVKNVASRTSRQKMLRKEIARIKRQMRKQDNPSASSFETNSPTEVHSRKRSVSGSEGEEANEISKRSKSTVSEQDEQQDQDYDEHEEQEEQEQSLETDPSSNPFILPNPPLSPSSLTIANPSPGRSRRSGILFKKRQYRPSINSPLISSETTITSESEDDNPLKLKFKLCQRNGLPVNTSILISPTEKMDIDNKSNSIINDQDMKDETDNPKSLLNSSYNESLISHERNNESMEKSYHRMNGETHSETSDDIIENPKSVDSVDSAFEGHFAFSHPFDPPRRNRTYTSSSANSDSEGPFRRTVSGHKRGRRPFKKLYSFSDDFGSLEEIEGIKSGIYFLGSENLAGEDLKDPKKDPEILNPLDLVWAKCRGYPSYPALVIDPKMPRSGFVHNGVPIPYPPVEVLKEQSEHEQYLVLFFDARRTWQWLSRSKLEPLGVDSRLDKSRLLEGRKSSMRKSVQQAYERAITHRRRVLGNYSDTESEEEYDSDGE